MADNSIIQPTKVTLKNCVIAGVPHIDINKGNIVENFVVHSLRIYEDICKSYFTAQLVIEDQINQTDSYLYPAAVVEISFMSLPTNMTYKEKFRVYSIESKPKANDLYASMLITINLIGDEYYNDTQNTVMQNFPNVTATNAAKQIHNNYLTENGSIDITDSIGMIGKTEHPHQVTNMKPIKAIHDLLDKAIYPPSSAFVYFRNKPGYVIAPLQKLLESSSVVGKFIQVPNMGKSLVDVLTGYDKIIHIRPMAPPSKETASGTRAAELDSLTRTSSFFDLKTGNFIPNVGKDGISKTINDMKSFKDIGTALLGAVKTQFGSRQNFNTINEDRQERTVDKNGPGGHNVKEQAFIAALSYKKKYWISIPMQEGIKVTIGRRIQVAYPMGETLQEKTLFVGRLIHELQFKTPGSKRYEPAQGTTEMYCVEW